MKSELKKIAKRAYVLDPSLARFLQRCKVIAYCDKSFVGPLFKDDETLDLIDWWKKYHAEQKYTIQLFSGEKSYLNLGLDESNWFISDNEEEYDFKTHFTKQEIEQLKQRDDLAIDWDKAKIEPVEDDE